MNIKNKIKNIKKMLDNYYLEIYDSNFSKTITVFVLYDFNKKIFFYGDLKIKDKYNFFNEMSISLNNKIPISKNLFNIFLELSLNDLQETNKNIFLTLNGLEEWTL